jgi:PAS domain S-box-containing protein
MPLDPVTEANGRRANDRPNHRIGFPVVVWDGLGTIVLANQAAGDVAGLPVASLVGTRPSDHISPPDASLHTMEDLNSGRLEGYQAQRSFANVAGGRVVGRVTTRSIRLEGRRLGVGVFLPDAELDRIGVNPYEPRPELVPIALGVAHGSWTIRDCAHVSALLGGTDSEYVGTSIIDLVNEEDVDAIARARADLPQCPQSLPRIRFTTTAGQEVELCMLLGAFDPTRGSRMFGLVGKIEACFARSSDRVQDLELRLQRIADEVQAAGLLGAVGRTPWSRQNGQLDQLTNRQWEILQRLLRGERVATIAAKLFISRSTVRNHLSTAFRMFDVHSQAELLEVLRAES